MAPSALLDPPRHGAVAEPRRSRQAAWLKIAALVAAGMATPFTLSLVGAVPVGEFVLLAALGCLWLRLALDRTVPGSLLRSRLLGVFMLCQTVAMLGYVVSDIYWGSSGTDVARGWARMIFLGLDILAVAFLFDLPDRLPEAGFLWFQLGFAFGGAAATLSGDVLFGDYWKFGWATPVTILVLLTVPRLGFWAGQLACLALGAAHFALDFRSLAAISLAVPLLLFIQRFPVRYRLLATASCAVLLAGGAAVGWRTLKGDGNNVRSSRSDIERGAMVQAAWDGFRRSPWVGNGSWFSKSHVMQEFYALRYERSVVDGVGSFEQDELDGTMAIHSQILVGLAEGGILGGCFFVCYGVMLAWALGFVVLTQSWQPHVPLCVLFLLVKVSDLLTSPFSGSHRILIGVAVGLIVVLWRQRRADARPPLGAPFAFAYPLTT